MSCKICLRSDGKKEGDVEEKVRRMGDHMRKAPDMLEPSFLSMGRIIFESTRRWRSASRVDVGGREVLVGLKRSVYVDNAVLAAVHEDGERRVLISDLRVLMYDFSMVCSLSCTASNPLPTLVSLPLIGMEEGKENASSSWLQYHSQSQVRACWLARLSSPSEGMCL